MFVCDTTHHSSLCIMRHKEPDENLWDEVISPGLPWDQRCTVQFFPTDSRISASPWSRRCTVPKWTIAIPPRWRRAERRRPGRDRARGRSGRWRAHSGWQRDLGGSDGDVVAVGERTVGGRGTWGDRSVAVGERTMGGKGIGTGIWGGDRGCVLEVWGDVEWPL